MINEEKKAAGRNKGGRPKKAVKRNYVIKVKCTILERKAIEHRAGEVGMRLSEYLREKGLGGNIISKQKMLPKEFLEYKALLHHTAANLNQIARTSNGTGELNRADKEALLALEQELKQHIVTMQNDLQK